LSAEGEGRGTIALIAGAVSDAIGDRAGDVERHGGRRLFINEYIENVCVVRAFDESCGADKADIFASCCHTWNDYPSRMAGRVDTNFSCAERLWVESGDNQRDVSENTV